MHRHLPLTSGEGRGDKAVNLLDALVGHGETADRFAGAMHHHQAAGVSVLAVECIGIADVKGQVII